MIFIYKTVLNQYFIKIKHFNTSLILYENIIVKKIVVCLNTTMQNGIFAVRLKLIFFINEKNN